MAARGKRAEVPQKSSKALILIPLLAVFTAFVGFDAYLSNNVPKLEVCDIVLKRLPNAFDGLKIVQLSDLHEKVFRGDNQALFELVRQAKPDIIAITGDFIDARKDLKYAEETLAELAKISKVYYVTGNHEWGADWKSLKQGGKKLTPDLKVLVKESGAIWLDNHFEIFEKNGETFALTGFTDPNGPADEVAYQPLLAKIRAQMGESVCIVALSHRFDKLDEYAADDLDLVLTGHGHGGGVVLPFVGGVFGPSGTLFPENIGGVFRKNNTVMVANRGLAGAGKLPRLFNRPQVLTITLKAETP